MEGLHPWVKLALLGLACVMFYFRDRVVRWVNHSVLADTDAACWLCRHKNRLSSALRYFECSRCGMENALVRGKGVIPPIKVPSDAR